MSINKSESISNIAKALITFHIKIGTIKKDSKNPFFKSDYASLSTILDSINTPLNESGLAITQFPDGENGLSTILMHGESGEYIESTYYMAPVKDDPQGRGSAMTYMRRYALASILALIIDEDDDANAASKQVVELPWLNEGSKEFEAAVKKLREGTTTLDKIKSVMKLSKKTEQLLVSLLQADLPY